MRLSWCRPGIRCGDAGAVPRMLSLTGLMLLVPLFILPVFSVLSRAFVADDGTFSLKLLVSLLSSSYIWRIVGFTLLQAAVSTAAAVLLGFPGAYLLSQYRFRGRFLIRAASSVPFVLPSIIVVLGFVVFYGSNGYLNRFLATVFGSGTPPLQILYSFKAIILAHAFYNFPVVLNMTASYWEQVGSRSEMASYTLGAGRFRTFAAVTLPKLYPAIASSAALVFLFCFTSFAIILVLGGGPRFTTIEVEIFRHARVSLDTGSAAALSLISMLISSGVLLLHIRLQRGMPGSTVGYLPRHKLADTPRITGSPVARIALVLYLAMVLLTIAAPIVSVVIRSFQTQATRSGTAEFSLRWYLQLFGSDSPGNGPLQGTSAAFARAPEAFRNSFLIALGALIVALPSGAGLAYFLRSPKIRRRSIPELAVMLPLAVSSVILGLGYYIIAAAVGSAAGSRMLIICAHAVITLPFITRAILPVLDHLRHSYRAAALTLGASPGRAFFTIELPVLKSALISGAVFASALSLGEINATLMLADEQTITIPVLLYRLIGAYNFYAACAVGTLLTLLCIALFALFEYAREHL